MENGIINNLIVERETYEKDGKTYFAHYIKGVVRGVNVKISVVPQDFGGYTVLDIVFNGENKAELVSTPYEIKDEKSGRIVKGNTYSVRSVDENGKVYACALKPARRSDKDLFNMLLN